MGQFCQRNVDCQKAGLSGAAVAWQHRETGA